MSKQTTITEQRKLQGEQHSALGKFAVTGFSVFDYDFSVWALDGEKEIDLCPNCKEKSLIQIGRQVSMSFVPFATTCCECGWAKLETC